MLCPRTDCPPLEIVKVMPYFVYYEADKPSGMVSLSPPTLEFIIWWFVAQTWPIIASNVAFTVSLSRGFFDDRGTRRLVNNYAVVYVSR